VGGGESPRPRNLGGGPGFHISKALDPTADGQVGLAATLNMLAVAC